MLGESCRRPASGSYDACALVYKFSLGAEWLKPKCRCSRACYMDQTHSVLQLLLEICLAAHYSCFLQVEDSHQPARPELSVQDSFAAAVLSRVLLLLHLGLTVLTILFQCHSLLCNSYWCCWWSGCSVTGCVWRRPAGDIVRRCGQLVPHVSVLAVCFVSGLVLPCISINQQRSRAAQAWHLLSIFTFGAACSSGTLPESCAVCMAVASIAPFGSAAAVALGGRTCFAACCLCVGLQLASHGPFRH